MKAEPGKTVYSSGAMTRGTASLDELRTLFLAWQPGEPAVSFARRVQAEGILTKNTAARLKDVLLKVFRPWFLEPDERPARQLKALVETSGERQLFSELVFLYKCRAEQVLYDFTQQTYWAAAQEGALYLRTQEIEDFLHEAQAAGKAAKSWSPATLERMSKGMLNALLMAGLLQETKHHQYDIPNFRPQNFTMAYLAYDLHLAGLTDSALVEHPDWKLFGLGRAQVLERLGALGEKAGLIVQQAGSVVRITWLYASMEEMIRAYYA
ncbi:MAG TPA: DUF1819 family protein [Anaerolineaceae bacterium]|nr:DUF1819 family protein [Anaerolineaceae bacterium]